MHRCDIGLVFVVRHSKADIKAFLCRDSEAVISPDKRLIVSAKQRQESTHLRQAQNFRWGRENCLKRLL